MTRRESQPTGGELFGGFMEGIFIFFIITGLAFVYTLIFPARKEKGKRKSR